jgi:DNA-directed RNA polymerase subunit K
MMIIMVERLTRFDRTRIISARALQIAAGAPILIKTDMADPKDIAKLEFEKGLLAMVPRKKMPKKLKEVGEAK